MKAIRYKPDGAVLKDFLRSNTFMRGIRGPIGSGKSVVCCMEIMRRAMEQEPDAEGLRRTRWAVVRNTNPQLKTTTIKTWTDWFDEAHWGAFRWSVPYTHHIKKPLEDHTVLDLEVLFLSLDKPEDVRKLLSLELTGIWINEAREVPKTIVDACTSRVGRFPSMRDGGPTWYGVIMDTNSPEDDHWWPIMCGDVPLPPYITEEEALLMVKPPNWQFFTQPPAMLKTIKNGKVTGYELNPKRENAKHTVGEYYPNAIQGKDATWINVYVCNQYGATMDGKPVFPEFSSPVHLSTEPLEAVPAATLWVGIDFGLSPAAVVAQLVRGQWRILWEFCGADLSTEAFATFLKAELAMRFPDHDLGRRGSVRVVGDPAGDARTAGDAQARTPYQILAACGIQASPAPGNNDLVMRLEAVKHVLNGMHDGLPRFILDPGCTTLKAGFAGGYHYKRVQAGGAARYADKPEKNRYSHPMDSLQYILVTAGESPSRRIGGHSGEARVATGDRSVFDRQERLRRGSPRLGAGRW